MKWVTPEAERARVGLSFEVRRVARRPSCIGYTL